MVDHRAHIPAVPGSIPGSASNCGRRVCSWCVPNRDLGPCPGIPAGQISHTMCDQCGGADYIRLNAKERVA